MSGVVLVAEPSAALGVVHALGDEVASSTLVWSDGEALRGVAGQLADAGWDELLISADDEGFSSSALRLRQQIHGVADVLVLHAERADQIEHVITLGRLICVRLPHEVPVLLAGAIAEQLAAEWRPIADELEIVQTAIATEELLVPMCSGAGKTRQER